MAQQNKSFHNPEYIDKKRKRILRRVIIVCTTVFLLIAGFAGLTHWKKVQVDTIQVNGTVILSSSDIQKQALQYISGNYFFIFNKKNALLYPKAGLTDFLTTQFPRIQSVQVSLTNYHTLGITLSERQPFALWCDTTPEDIASSSDPTAVPNCYFLDQSGFVFAHAPDFSGDAYFKYYGLLPYASPIGSSYLSSDDTFGQLSSFVTSIKALNITPLYIVATDEHDFDMYIYGGGEIIFDDTTPLSDTAYNLQRLLQTANLVPKENGELLVDYIDLRYGNKLYYKVRQ